jgi:hypothetical protein
MITNYTTAIQFTPVHDNYFFHLSLFPSLYAGFVQPLLCIVLETSLALIPDQSGNRTHRVQRNASFRLTLSSRSQLRTTTELQGNHTALLPCRTSPSPQLDQDFLPTIKFLALISSVVYVDSKSHYVGSWGRRLLPSLWPHLAQKRFRPDMSTL